MKRPLLKAAQAAALLLGCLCLAVLLYELLLRVQGRSPVQELYTRSEGAGVRFLPHLDLERKGIRLRTNAFGIRDDQDGFGDTPTLLVFGDSNVAGLFLEFEDTFTEQLERQLAARGLEVAALNFGVPAYGPDQSVALFLEVMAEAEAGEIDLGRPQAVVLHVFADNDHGDLFKNNILRPGPDGRYALHPFRPDPSLDWPTLWYTRYPSLAAVVRIAGLVSGVPPSRMLFALAPDDFYHLRFENDCKAGRPESCNESGVRAFIGEGLEYGRRIREAYDAGRYTTWLDDYYDFDLALNAPHSRGEQTTAMLADLFALFRAEARRHGMLPLVLVQPSEFDVAETNAVTPRILEEYARERGLDYAPDNLVRIAVEAAERAGVRCIDLFGLYAASTGNYFTLEEMGFDNHWNPTGVERAAELLADDLAPRLDLPPPPGSAQ